LYLKTLKSETSEIEKSSKCFCLCQQIRETRRTVRDTRAGVEKMAVGRHIDDRGHVITKQRDRHSGNIEEHQDYLNIDEGRKL